MTARSRSVPRIHPWLLDGVLTGVLALTGVVVLFVYTDPSGIEYQDGDALGVVIVLAVTAPILVRRRWPLAVGLITATGVLAFTVWDYAMPTAVVVMLIAVYSAASHATVLRSLMVAVAHTGASFAYMVGQSERHPEQADFDLVSMVLNTMVFVAVWGIGRSVRNRRLYMAELEDRTQRLERANCAEVKVAIAEERSRIARELHDVVAHHVSVMTVQAAGARRSLHRDIERSAQAMQAIEDTGRAALAEMRRVVGVLRGPEREDGPDDGPADRAPQPGLGDLGSLAEHVRAAGVPVRITVDGEPTALPLGVDLAAYRVVQEALTNTIKHGGPSTATVYVRYQPAELYLQVTDDGNGIAAALDGRRPGHGLLGMRERVALYGGTLAVGPRHGGGFEVRAKIPYDNDSRNATMSLGRCDDDEPAHPGSAGR